VRVTLGFFSRLCQAKQKEQVSKQECKNVQPDNLKAELVNDSFEKSVSFGVFGAERTLNKRNVELLGLAPEIWQRILGNPSPSHFRWILEGSWEVLHSPELLASRVAEQLTIINKKFPKDKVPKLKEELVEWLFLKRTTQYDPIPPNIAKAAGIKPRVVEETPVVQRKPSRSLQDEGFEDILLKKKGNIRESGSTDDPNELAQRRFEREWIRSQKGGTTKSQKGETGKRRPPKRVTIDDKTLPRRSEPNAVPPNILKDGIPYTVEDINTIHRMLSDGTPDDVIIKYAREHGLDELAHNLAELAEREAKEAAAKLQSTDLPTVSVVKDVDPPTHPEILNAQSTIFNDSSIVASQLNPAKKAAEAVEPKSVIQETAQEATAKDRSELFNMVRAGVPDEEVLAFAQSKDLTDIAQSAINKRKADLATLSEPAKVVPEQEPKPDLVINQTNSAQNVTGSAESVRVDNPIVSEPKTRTTLTGQTDEIAKAPAKPKKERTKPQKVEEPAEQFVKFSLLNAQLQPGRLDQFVDSGIISKEGFSKALDGVLNQLELENVFNGRAPLSIAPQIVVDKLTMFLLNEHKVIELDLKNIKNELGRLLYDPNTNPTENINNLISLLGIQKSNLNKSAMAAPTLNTSKSDDGKITDDFRQQLAMQLKGKGLTIEDPTMQKQTIKVFDAEGNEIHLPDRPISIRPAAASEIVTNPIETASTDVVSHRSIVDLQRDTNTPVELAAKSNSDALVIKSTPHAEPIKQADILLTQKSELNAPEVEVVTHRPSEIVIDVKKVDPLVIQYDNRLIVQTHPLAMSSEPLIGKCFETLNFYSLRGIINAPDLTKLFGLKNESQAISILGNAAQLPFAPAVNSEILADYLITKHKAELKPEERAKFIGFVQNLLYTKAPFISRIDEKIQSELNRYKPKTVEILEAPLRKGRKGSRALQKAPHVLTFDDIIPGKPELVKLKEAIVNAGLTVQAVCDLLSCKPFQLMRKFKDDPRIFFYGQDIFALSRKTGQNLFVTLDGEPKFKPEKLNFTEFPDIDLETAKNRIKDNLVQARLNEGIATQKEGSEKTGIAVQTFSNIEHGKQSISIPNLFKCLEAYKNTTLEKLFAKPAEKPVIVVDATSQGGTEVVGITKLETLSHLVPHLDINRPEDTKYPIITAQAAKTKARRVLTKPKSVMTFDNIVPVKQELIKLKQALIDAGVSVQDACEVLGCSEGKLENLFTEAGSFRSKMQFKAHHIYLLSIKAKTDLFRIFDENNVLKSESLKLDELKLTTEEKAKENLAKNLLRIREVLIEKSRTEISDDTKISKAMIEHFESGAVGVNMDQLKKFAVAYEEPLSRLFADNVTLSHLVPHLDINRPIKEAESEIKIVKTLKPKTRRSLMPSKSLPSFDDLKDKDLSPEMVKLKQNLVNAGLTVQDACEVIGTTAARLNHMFNESKVYKFSAHHIYLLSIKTKTNLFRIFDEGNVLKSDLIDFNNAQLISSKEARELSGKNIRSARYNAGKDGNKMSAKDAALNTGIDYKKIQNIESGLIGATLDELKKFAEVYKVSLDKLFAKSGRVKESREIEKIKPNEIKPTENSSDVLTLTNDIPASANVINPNDSEIVITANPLSSILTAGGTPADVATASTASNLGYSRIKAGDGRLEEMIKILEYSNLPLTDAARAISYGKDTFVSKLKGKTDLYAEELAILSGKTGKNLFTVFNGNCRNTLDSLNYAMLAGMDVKTVRSMLAERLAQSIGTSREEIAGFANKHGYPSRFSVQFIIDGSSKVSVNSFMRLCRELGKAPEEFFS